MNNKTTLTTLNKSQQAAANHNKGPMLVLAGPGSGKTAVIVIRIKNLIEKYHVSPQNILAVTFSKAAAKEMSERFSKLAAEYSVSFSTLHALCFGILRSAGGYEHTNILTEVARGRIIREVLDDMTSAVPAFNNTGYNRSYDQSDSFNDNVRNSNNSYSSNTSNIDTHICNIENGRESFCIPRIESDTSAIAKKLSDEISRFKSTGLDKNFRPSEIIAPFFVQGFRAYESKKRASCAIDFDDMLIYAYEMLKRKPKLLADLQAKYTYILADEFQDTNPLQYKILKLLASSGTQNLFAVGDDDQSIYGFRGAVPAVMKNFLKDFKDAKTILLDVNYRCRPEIIKSSLQLISFNKNRFDKKIKSAYKNKNTLSLNHALKNIPVKDSFSMRENTRNSDTADITSQDKCFCKTPNDAAPENHNEILSIKEFPTVSDECDFICSELLSALRSGKDISDIAVLYRNSYEAVSLITQLKMLNIPFTASEKLPDPFSHFIAADLLAYIRVAVCLSDDKNRFFRDDASFSIKNAYKATSGNNISSFYPNNHKIDIQNSIISNSNYSKSDGKYYNIRADFLRIINKPLRYISRLSLDNSCINLSSNTQGTYDVYAPKSDKTSLDADIRKTNKAFPASHFFISMYRFYSDKPYMLERVRKLEADLHFIACCTPYAAIKYIRHAVGYEKHLKEYAKEKRLPFSDFENILNLLESTAANFKTHAQFLKFVDDYQDNASDNHYFVSSPGSHTNVSSSQNLRNNYFKNQNIYAKKSDTVSKKLTSSEYKLTLSSCHHNDNIANNDNGVKNGVHIMTMHASKGLEFDTVFIPQLNAGFIPHSKSLTPAEIEEERRLLYVAMTRAKNRLVISFDKTINEKSAKPSQFIDELTQI